MSLISVSGVAVLALIFSCDGVWAATSCPAYLGAHALVSAQLFDGPPADKVDLQSNDGSWDLTPYKASPHRYFLVCHFARSAATKLVSLPAAVSGCRTSVHAGATLVDCE